MKIISYIIPAVIILVAVLLFLDASTFALFPSDPITGRDRGCYTAIELLVGVKQPSWIRGAEYIIALALISLNILAFIMRRWRKKDT